MSLRLLFLFLILAKAPLCLARLAADELDPSVYVVRVVQRYNSLVNDPLIKKGLIKDFLKREELSDLNEKDYKFLSRAIASDSLLTDIQFSTEGSVVSINDKRISKTALDFDFKDYTKRDSRVVYINGQFMEFKNVPKKPTQNQTRFLEQIKDIKKLLNPEAYQEQSSFIQWLLFPFQISAAKAQANNEIDGNGIIALSSMEYVNISTNKDLPPRKGDIQPGSHDAPRLKPINTKY